MSLESSPSPKSPPAPSSLRLSIDVWAVIIALLLAAFVRTGVIKHIPW